jgi:hypothetical protein
VRIQEEFSVIDVIVSFCGSKGLGKIGRGMPIAIGVRLEEDGTRSGFRSISGDGEWGREVGHVEDGFAEEQRFQGVESGLTAWGPLPREVFLGKVNKGACDIGVVRDKASIEVGKAKERADILYRGRGRPGGNAIEFHVVHGKLSWFDYHSEVIYLGNGESALLKFEMQV